MVIMKKHLVFYIIAAIALLGFSKASKAEEQQEPTQAELPGYYEFFMKAGKLTRLKGEVKRDEKIQTGELKPVYGSEPIASLQLPDGFGNLHGTRDQVGNKNLVLITGRAWW